VGEPSTSQTSDAFSQTRYEGQEESESGNQSQVVGQIEGLLGGKKNQQQVIHPRQFLIQRSRQIA